MAEINKNPYDSINAMLLEMFGPLIEDSVFQSHAILTYMRDNPSPPVAFVPEPDKFTLEIDGSKIGKVVFSGRYDAPTSFDVFDHGGNLIASYTVGGCEYEVVNNLDGETTED